jgi:hypothetical protein
MDLQLEEAVIVFALMEIGFNVVPSTNIEQSLSPKAANILLQHIASNAMATNNQVRV